MQIRSFHVENFKSLASLDLELGRVNVLIGENGCGKSNILEAIAFTSAGLNKKLDHEYLASRGIRATDAQFMFSAFERSQPSGIKASVGVTSGNVERFFLSTSPDQTDSRWVSLQEPTEEKDARFAQLVRETKTTRPDQLERSEFEAFLERVAALRLEGLDSLADFLIYSPENSALRTFQASELSSGREGDLGVRYSQARFAYSGVSSPRTHRCQWEWSVGRPIHLR